MAMHHLSLFAMLLPLLYFKLSPVNGGEIQQDVHGKLVFQIISYSNKHLVDDYGRPCDNYGDVAKQDCEIYFKFMSSWKQKVQRKTTPVKILALDTGFLSFTDNETGYRFEAEIPASLDPEKFSVYVNVRDQDAGGVLGANEDDDVEMFQLPPITAMKVAKVWEYVKLNGRPTAKYKTELKLKYRLECYPSYGGLWCSQSCKIKESIAHTCNRQGKPICKQHYYPAEACNAYCKPEHRYKCSVQGQRLCNKFWKGSDCYTLEGYRSRDKYRGKIVMKVSWYQNTHGIDGNGEFCDGESYNNCEIYFYMKSKVRNKESDYKETNEFFMDMRKVTIYSAADVDREDLDKDSSNKLEMEIPVNFFENETITQTIEVWEDDHIRDDYMETFHIDYRELSLSKDWKYSMYTLDKDGSKVAVYPKLGIYKVRLQIKYKLVCYRPYKGNWCYGRDQ